MAKITRKNYYSLETNQDYMSASQFKDFLKCEAYALAKIRGEWVDETTDALLIGQYVDAYFNGELEEFKQEHPDIFNSRTGELKSQYIKANEIIKVAEDDPMFYAFMTGVRQKIYVGEINGVPFKAMVDSDFPDKTVDGKVMKDLKPIWNEEKHCKESFIKAYGYDIQGAIYQELKRQCYDEKVPFILAPITKEKVPTKALINVEQETLDDALELVKEKAPHFQDLKLGLEAPTYCGKCDYCKSVLKLNKILSSKEFEPYDNSEIESED